jgi:hypothetical protein
MPRYRIFSNGVDQTYNGYYNPDLIKNLRCKNKPHVGKVPPCADDPIKPPITAFQASTSYIQASALRDAKSSPLCSTGCIYPRGQFLNANELLDPGLVPPLPPPFLPERIGDIPDQAVLEYGAVAPSTNGLIPNCPGVCALEPMEECPATCALEPIEEPCLGIFSHEPINHLAETHNYLPTPSCAPQPHAHTHSQNHCNPHLSHEMRKEMEWLKTYRFKCYQCINPTCSANALALEAYRSNLNYSSGNIVTTMTYGSTGSTRTTTTTTTMTTSNVT